MLFRSAMAMRVSIVLCFRHPEAILATLGRMGEVVEAVGYAESRDGKAEKRSAGGAGKVRGVVQKKRRRG